MNILSPPFLEACKGKETTARKEFRLSAELLNRLDQSTDTATIRDIVGEHQVDRKRLVKRERRVDASGISFNQDPATVSDIVGEPLTPRLQPILEGRVEEI